MARLRRLCRRRSARSEEGRFVIEGPVLVAEALAAGVPVEELLAAPGVASDVLVVADAQGVPVRFVRAEVLGRALDARTPPGIAAVARKPTLGLVEVLASAGVGPLALVLVDVADPGNAGTLMRAAEGSGASAVFFCGASVDPYNPKCVRASAGALFHVPVADGGEPAAVLDDLHGAGVRCVATAARGGTPHDQADLTGPVAVVFGNEAHGLPPELEPLVHERVTIPLAGRTESLNVAMAGSILCFEALGQRRRAQR